MSTDYRWEWTLKDGEKVVATVDTAMKTESVYVDGAFVSSAPRGSKPDGHVLASPSGVVVTFQSGALIAILRVDGEEVSPSSWPVKRRQERPKPKIVELPVRLVAILVAVAAAAGVLFYVAKRWIVSANADAGGAALSGVYRAENGRFVAHYPPRFAARKAESPSGTSTLVLEDRNQSAAIVIVAQASGEVPREPWLVQKKLAGEALTALPRGGGAWQELARADETCDGQPGAVVRGRVDDKDVWSCAFVKDDAAYLTMYSLPNDATTEDVQAMRGVLESTELTHLAELGGGK